MSDNNLNCEDENEELKARIEDLKNELVVRKEQAEELIQQREDLNIENDKLRGRIKFLEGQIEAYQYCMNCRR